MLRTTKSQELLASFALEGKKRLKKPFRNWLKKKREVGTFVKTFLDIFSCIFVEFMELLRVHGVPIWFTKIPMIANRVCLGDRNSHMFLYEEQLSLE